jgi:hypothetical protein
LKVLNAALFAGTPLMPSPPPVPYEIETPVGINAIRQIRREE